MISLIAAAVLFIGIHLLISGTGLRGSLVSRLGERSYRGLFSLISLGAVVWLSMSFPPAEAQSVSLWNLGLAARWITVVLVLVATILVVLGLTTPNPTSVGHEKLLQTASDPVRGILRITRHPFLIGVAFWALAHILATGQFAALILFGTFLVVALIGPSSIDAKRRAAGHWERFANATSIVPFGAILAGRNRLVLSELLTWRLAAAIAVFAALAVIHPLIFSVPALPL